MATVNFATPIPVKNWTCVTHTGSGDGDGDEVCLGYLPGDVSGNLLSNASDITALIDSINNVPGRVRPIYATDADRSGVTAALDISREIDILNGAGALDPFLAATLVPCP